MKISYLKADNFRTLDEFEVTFDPIYTAISGVNNCGKSNLIDAIRLLIGEEDPEYGPGIDTSLAAAYPKWKLQGTALPDDCCVTIEGTFLLDRDQDASIIAFIKRYLSIDFDCDEISIEVECGKSSFSEQVKIKIRDQEFVGQPAAEVRKRLRDGTSLIYHNSTTESVRTRYIGGLGQLSELSKAAQTVFDQSRSELTKKLKKATAPQQLKLQQLVQNMSDKLTVEIELPRSFGFMPFNLALNQGGGSVPLGSWGSGTQNRTLIMLALIRAAQGDDVHDSTERLTPIIVIEEPESFLHPAAQSEFGTMIMTIAQDLGVQVIVATHSVGLLNSNRPSSNILLERETFRGKPKSTKVVQVEENNWMQPFANLLGYNTESFGPWQDALKLRGKKVLLVEGDIDKRYLERIQDQFFGKDALNSAIEIFAYNGAGNLKAESILRLVIQLSDRCVITCDLDAYDKVENTFKILNLAEGKDHTFIGKGDGRGCIEDYVPQAVHEKVYAANPSLVSKLMGASSDARSAKSSMKSKICEYFLDHAKQEDFADFLSLAKRLNKMFV